MLNRNIKNASWIIACKIVQAILGLIISMLTARYLGPANYGIINYAASIVSFAVPIMQLGFTNILVHETVEFPNEEGKIYGTSLLLNVLSAIACIGGISIFTLFVNAGNTITIIVCVLYSLMLIPQAAEMIQYWFQAKLLSKYTSIVSLLSYTAVSAYKIYLLISSKNVYWFAVSNSLDYLLVAALLVFIYVKLGGQKLSFSKAVAKRMFGYSKHYIFSAMMITIFSNTDRVMLNLMVGENATGYYSAAVTCAGMAGFVFSAIIDSARPTIYKNKKDGSKEAFESKMSFLYSIVFWLAIIQCVVIFVFADPIILLLYGNEFAESAPALRIIVWYTTFAYIGGARDIWVLAENKQKWLWVINLSGAILNIVFNYILIPFMGIMGAALASLFTQFFSNFIITLIIKDTRRNNLLIIRGLNPVPLLSFFSSLFRRGRKKG